MVELLNENVRYNFVCCVIFKLFASIEMFILELYIFGNYKVGWFDVV